MKTTEDWDKLTGTFDEIRAGFSNGKGEDPVWVRDVNRRPDLPGDIQTLAEMVVTAHFGVR